MLITDQVATAPCSDPIQVRFLLLRQSRVNLASSDDVRAFVHKLLRRRQAKTPLVPRVISAISFKRTMVFIVLDIDGSSKRMRFEVWPDLR